MAVKDVTFVLSFDDKGTAILKKATKDGEDGIQGIGESPDPIDDTSSSGVESPKTKTGQKTP